MNKYKVKNAEQPEFDEQDKRIYEEFIELGWLIPQTEQEVNRAENALEKIETTPLPAELEDSSIILERIRNRSSQKVNVDETEQVSNTKPYLGYVSDETGLPPSKIEQEIGYSTEFLVQITEYPEVIEEPIREEVTNKTLLKFPNLNRKNVLCSLKQRSLKKAAARNTPYSNDEITFEKILESSEMSEEDKKRLLELNKGGK